MQNFIGIAGTVSEEAAYLRAVLEVDPGAASSTDDSAETLLAAGVVVSGQDLARQMQAQADELRKEALAIFAGPDVVGVEIAYEGATLQHYAQVYYGDQQKWTAIAAYNSLATPKLAVGDIVVVPRYDEGLSR